MMLGFLEVSLCRYTEALNVLDAQIASFRTTPVCTEIISATFIPDAVEAFLATGRAEEAEPLIAAVETNGAMLQRPWMMAVGARCRAMILAHAGELDAAESVAHRAMAVHAQLPMPFERARTQLVLGQIQRRRRQRGHAARTFAEALVEFDRIGTKLWAARAGAELERTRVSSGGALELSPAERRVAERASAGMSNREIAAELFVSVKTVESGLSSVYRKLGIRSRAQLCAILTP
jgi:DNA-binding CsgD family transcriptional regulator